MYPDDLSLWDESEEKLIVMIGRFVEVCKGKTRKVKSNKDQDDVVRRWEGLVCQVQCRLEAVGTCFGVQMEQSTRTK